MKNFNEFANEKHGFIPLERRSRLTLSLQDVGNAS